MEKKSHDLLFNIMLIGDSCVGKTSISFRFVNDSFSSFLGATIGIDSKVKTIELEGKRIKLQIWNNAMHGRLHPFTAPYYRDAMGIMLVYSMMSKNSFENIPKMIENIKNLASHDVETIIIANMSDMSQRREISSAEGLAVAEQHGVKHFETSAKDGTNVKHAFEELTRALLNKIPKDQDGTQR